jgi:hypothetical protein
MFKLVGTLKPFTMAHKLSTELQSHMANNPHITSVWVSQSGEWYFVPLEGCTELTREQVLKAEAPTTQATAEESTEPTTPKKTTKK